MKRFLIAWAIGLLLSINGCADMFVTKTRLIYVSPEGRQIDLTAGKDYEDVDVQWETMSDKTVKARVRIGKAGTPAEAMAGVMRLYERLLDRLDKLAPLIEKGAMAGS